MATLSELSTTQLRQALQLSEQIDALQERLQSLLSGSAPTPRTAAVKGEASPGGSGKGRRKMSAATKAKMRAAQQARWANIRGKAGTPAAAPKAAKATGGKKRGLTPEGRAKLAAAMKARWAARKKGGAAPNAPSA